MNALKALWSASSAGQLTAKGILGMNCRNISYISRYNARHLYPLVDDKLQTKELALENGVNVPDLVGVIRSQHDIRTVEALTASVAGFCIKPAKGAGGKGILVISKTQEGGLKRTNGTSVSYTHLTLPTIYSV